MLASGFAALAYQIIWTQQSTAWLGHEAAAVLAVIAAFFGGMALGALALGARIDRSERPARWYAACEAAIAVWSVVLAFLLAPASRWLLNLTGAQPTVAWHWLVAFGGTFLLLLPATVAMGATLPAMERMLAQLRQAGSSLAALYACNTLGAVAGVLAAAFWLVPQLGLAATAAVCAGLNGVCAAIGLALAPNRAALAPAPAPALQVAAPQPRLLALLAATGLLGIGYEVLVVRVLSQVCENTVYTFAMLLAIYLLGTAMGAAAYQCRRPAAHAFDRVRDRLLVLLAAACLLGTASLWGADSIKAAGLRLFGSSLAAALGVEAMLAVAAFLPPTLAMGALFSHLGTHARAVGIGVGRSLGINMLGGAAAPLLFGGLMPVAGPKLALLGVVGGYLALSVRRARLAPAAWSVMVAGVALAAWAPPLAFVDVPEGGRIVSYRDGAFGAVSIVEDADRVARLHIDNRQQEGSSATLLADARQALLPVLLHPAPRRALFLGLGTGLTATAAAQDAMLQVDAVELLPEVIEASRHFRHMVFGTTHQPRLNVIAADARRYVRAIDRHYDLIVSDNFHPARRGSGALYTVEHFEAVRMRLAADGVFCQWLPLHQLDLPTLRSIVRTFVAVFPGSWALLATNSLDTPVLGLVARRDGQRFDVEQVRARLASAALSRSAAEFGLSDELALLGSFVAGPQALHRFAGDAALNTDDRPVVAHRAPRLTYQPDSLPRDRLLELLSELALAPEELVQGAAGTTWHSRLAAYMAARDRYLEAGRTVRPSADVRRMLAQVREPLLSVLRTSPDFIPAYDPLLRMALALGNSDPVAAHALLTELNRLQPARPEAAQALRRLGNIAH